MNRRAFLMGAVATAATPARGEEISNASALTGGRFMAGGQEFHLADVLAPSAYALHADAEPYFAEARGVLRGLLGSGSINIEAAGEPTRWGARVVHARRAGDDLSIQERVVDAGAARVMPQTDDLALIDRLLAAETRARTARRGLWRLDAYKVFDAGTAEGAVGAFHLIEGTVLNAVSAGRRFYLNFGEDYKTDFTASAKAALYRRWAKTGFDLTTLSGARVRIRSFVDAINGPSVDLTHMRQVEVLA